VATAATASRTVERSCTRFVLASLASTRFYERTLTTRAVTDPTTTKETIEIRAQIAARIIQ